MNQKKERTHMDIQIEKSDKEMIAKAAKKLGLTMAAFVRMATIKAARELEG